MVKDPHAQADKIYRQMIDLLQEAVAVYVDMEEVESDDEEHAPLKEEDMIDGLVEEAVERGIDEEHVERLFKTVVALVKKSAEG